MKNNKLILLDLFSGMGGFHLGLSDAGFDFKKVYYSEIDKHAIANYKYNFKDAEYIGTVEHILSTGIERPNIITFGSPCQDFSLAGKRKGLEGDRSSLIEHAIDAISHFRPDVFIWENVKGTFSSNAGEDFWQVIQAFANIGGYEIEWQLVNTSWLLPQNRERIYLVGHLATSFRDWKGVFPIGEGNEISNQSNEDKKEVYETALTITAKGRTNWTGSFINIAGKINSSQDGVILHDDGLSNTLTAGNYNVPKIMQKGHGYVSDSINDSCPTIRSNSFEHNTAVTQPPTIRRLTEIECERLQGFPDDWTKWGIYDGEVKQISKTQRYKMIGNAVTAKMVELIGLRILNNFNN